MKHILIFSGIILAFASCKKTDDGALVPTTLKIAISHNVSDAPLYFDSLIYHNAAGEMYSISKLNYYLSDIRFYKNNELVFALDTVAYIDAGQQNYTIGIANIADFGFDSISYLIGVPPALNAHDKLAPTYENVAMEWPDMMGGGYHFIKLEGHWQDGTGLPGFTVHLGTDAYLVKGGLKATGVVSPNKITSLNLQMDINKWFEGSHNYSFQTDGTYTMGNAALMQMIMENGRNVFEMKP